MRLFWVFIPLLAFCLAAGCSDMSGDSKTQQRMFQSSGKYSEGYGAGNRDAQWALTEVSGAWVWLWAADPEYQQGYEQGWSDGRELAKLKARQADQDKE